MPADANFTAGVVKSLSHNIAIRMQGNKAKAGING